MELFKGWQKILILAVLLRLLVMPFYFHPDIKTYNFQASFLKEGIFDIYSYLEVNKSQLPLKEEFVYFPLTYFFLGTYQIIAQPILGSNFNHWLFNASASASEQIGVFRYLFVLKFPYLIFDIVIGFLLCKFFTRDDQKRQAFTLWFFNPISIVIIYAFSNIDIIIVSLSLLSLLFAKNGKLLLAALFLGIGAGFKAYPLLFIPLLFLCGKTSKQKFQILFASFVPFLIIIAPFLTSASFRESTLTSGLMTRITMAVVSLSFNEFLMLGIMVLAGFFYWLFIEARITKEFLWRYFFILLLLIFSLTHFHIQWLLWILPVSILVMVENRRLSFMIVSLLILAFLIPLLYDDKAMTVGLLANISPLYNLLPAPFAVLQKIYDPYFLQSILHSIFAGGSMVLGWKMLSQKQL